MAMNRPAQAGRSRHPDLSLEPAAAGTRASAGSDQTDDSSFAFRADSNQFDRPHAPSKEEIDAHDALVARIDDAVWSR